MAPSLFNTSSWVWPKYSLTNSNLQSWNGQKKPGLWSNYSKPIPYIHPPIHITRNPNKRIKRNLFKVPSPPKQPKPHLSRIFKKRIRCVSPKNWPPIPNAFPNGKTISSPDTLETNLFLIPILLHLPPQKIPLCNCVKNCFSWRETPRG